MIISYPPAHSFEHLSILRCQPTNPPAICASILPSPTTYFFPSHPASTSTQLFILLDHRLINRPPPFDRPTERTIHTPNHPSCTPPSHRNSRPASSIHTFHRTIDIDHPNQILHPTPSGRLRDKRVLNRSPPPPPWVTAPLASMCPLASSSSTASRNKQAVKFSTLDHPPRAHLLPPAALLSLLCLAFLCLLFVCFRHTELIIKLRSKLSDLIRSQYSSLLGWIEDSRLNRQERRIRLIESAENEAEETDLTDRSFLSTRHHHPHHHSLHPHSLIDQDLDPEDEFEEDNEVLP